MSKTSDRRERRRQMESPPVLPALEQIIALLVEIIQRPKNSPRQWARRLARQQLEQDGGYARESVMGRCG